MDGLSSLSSRWISIELSRTAPRNNVVPFRPQWFTTQLLGPRKHIGILSESPLSGSPQRRFLALTLLNQAGSIPGLVRIRLEEHENHHAGDRNVEPNGERQACDAAVDREPARQREKERREHHRQRDDGKDYVAA